MLGTHFSAGWTYTAPRTSNVGNVGYWGTLFLIRMVVLQTLYSGAPIVSAYRLGGYFFNFFKEHFVLAMHAFGHFLVLSFAVYALSLKS